MNQTWKKRWIAALRGGKYQQGRGQLRHEGQHCCLGVLCDITEPDGWQTVEQRTEIGDLLIRRQEQHRGHAVMVGPSVAAKAQLDYADEKVLMEMNDGGVPFDRIADYIEENL